MNSETLPTTVPAGDLLAGMDVKGALAAGIQQQPWEPPLPVELAGMFRK